MDDLTNKAKEDMSLFERVMSGVPGIKGYKEKELRRETDKTVRNTLAQLLEDQKTRLDGIQMEMVGGGQIDLLDDMERAGRKLQRLIDRIRTASYGYAPLFDAVKVKEEELDALGQFDRGLFAGVERITALIDQMTTLGGLPEQDWKEPLRALSTAIDTMNTEFSHRNDVILQAA